MKQKEISVIELYNLLLEDGIYKYKGNITFKLGETSTVIKGYDRKFTSRMVRSVAKR